MSDTHPPARVDAARTWLLEQARAWRAEHGPDMAAVYAWRARFLTATGPIPALGSVPWLALPDTDPHKTAAAVGPAVAYLTENTPAAIAMRLRRELAAVDRAVVERIRAMSWDLSGAQDWRRAAYSPSWRVLVQRRLTFLCPDCQAGVPWRTARCRECGWTEPTPAQTRARALTSWTTPAAPDTSTDRSAA